MLIANQGDNFTLALARPIGCFTFLAVREHPRNRLVVRAMLLHPLSLKASALSAHHAFHSRDCSMLQFWWSLRFQLCFPELPQTQTAETNFRHTWVVKCYDGEERRVNLLWCAVCRLHGVAENRGRCLCANVLRWLTVLALIIDFYRWRCNDDASILLALDPLASLCMGTFIIITSITIIKNNPPLSMKGAAGRFGAIAKDTGSDRLHMLVVRTRWSPTVWRRQTICFCQSCFSSS